IAHSFRSRGRFGPWSRAAMLSRHFDHDTPSAGVLRDSIPVASLDRPTGVRLGDHGTMRRPAPIPPEESGESPDMPPATSDPQFDATTIEEKTSGSALAGRRMVTAALLVAMTVTAMEQLVVSPAMPTIIAQLRGFEIYPWVISAYLLAATVSTPI